MVNSREKIVDSTPTGAETYSSAMPNAKNYISWILGAFETYLEGPIIEIGIGHCSYVPALKRYGPYLGIDIDRRSVTEARKRFPELAFEVADVTDQGFPGTVATMGAKSVVCLNVLEHTADHQLAADNLARTLARGGHLLMMVPALPALYNDLDRLAGHYRRYQLDETRDLIERAGLKVERLDYLNPLGGVGWWANRFMHHKSLNEMAVNSQITLFDNWLVPISRSLDPLTRRFFGQSVIAVGRKP